MEQQKLKESGGRLSSAIWSGLKYGAIAYGLFYLFKWVGWIS
jgi:hypothetical protein